MHDAGGQVYVDGANLNALVGLARPGRFGGDVSHLNLHKTFCIPHGGGGPGVGPVAVRAHLAPFLPGHPLAESPPRPHAVSAAPYGSASILPITWAYIRMMGAERPARGVADRDRVGQLHRPPPRRVLPGALHRRERHGRPRVHPRPARRSPRSTGVTVDDVAKRLADYGFHAPTMSFPVAGTLMVEPTESENLDEIDAFCEAMIAIRAEIDQVAARASGRSTTTRCAARRTRRVPAGRRVGPPLHAASPRCIRAARHRPKVWPSVRRIDGAYGDRNLVCSCPPLEAFA